MSGTHKYTHILIKYAFTLYKDIALCNLTKSTHLWNQHPDQEMGYFSSVYILDYAYSNWVSLPTF